MTSLKNIFPYEPRKGQVKLVKDIVSTIEKGNQLLIHAPTGIGKTICALTAARYTKTKCIFVTPRQFQHKIVIDSMKDIKDGKVISIIGKQDMCINDDIKTSKGFYEACLNSKCPYKYKNDYYETPEKSEYVEDFIEYCRAHECCPYYASIQEAGRADIIIANYRHIFDPAISKIFFEQIGVNEIDCVLIVDEAHNLPDVLRSIGSMTVTENTINRAMNELRYMKNIMLGDRANKILGNKILFKIMDIVSMKKEILDKDRLNILQDDVNLLHTVGRLILKEKKDSGILAPVSYVQRVAEFFSMWLDEDEVAHIRILERLPSMLKLNIKCLEPRILSDKLLRFGSCVLMSGTLEPIQYFKDVLGLDTAILRKYPSVFPVEHRTTVIHNDLTTAYSSRSDRTYKDYTNRIGRICNRTKGNVIAFFPSYSIMNKVNDCLIDMKKKYNMIFEDDIITVGGRKVISESKKILPNIHEILESRDNLVLGVMRGSLSEGIDYPDNLLSSVIICGFPYPAMDVEQKCLTEYYNVKKGNGFVYASLFPTVNVILQTMGRPIRSPTDKATIHLIDKRFEQYERYFK